MNNSVRMILLSVLFAVMFSACESRQVVNVTQSETAPAEIQYDGLADNPQPINQKNQYDTLNVATYITKIGNVYFISDCYHNQIIYSDTLQIPLSEWNVLTNEVHYAHTIASDGTMILVDDTENSRLLAFQKTSAGYVHTQTLEGIGMKPHFIQYYEKERMFAVWSSITGELYLIKRNDTPNEQGIYPLYIEGIVKIDELYGVYVRSFTITDDGIYFVSGHNNQSIIKAEMTRIDGTLSLTVTDQYRVPDNLAGMVQIYKIQDYYYITVSTDNTENQDYATIIRTKDLDTLKTGKYEDIYADFGLSGGTPYYINEIEGRYYMTHHRTSENIIAFDVKNNVIENVEILY